MTHSKRWLVAGMLLGLTMASRAAETAPVPQPVDVELRALVEKTKTKLATGARTETALAEELKGFDQLLEEHRAEKTDAVADVLFMKAALYLQVFENFERGGELLRQVQKDFPDTKAATRAGQFLVLIDQQKKSLQLQAALQPGGTFPDFQAQDLSGAPLSLGRFKGKVLLVDFWATWCGPCVAEFPNVHAAYEKFHPQGFEIVGISLDRDVSALKSFIKEKDVTWAQYFDGLGWENKLAQKYGITSIPATFLLDGNGRILARDLRGPELAAELGRLLAK